MGLRQLLVPGSERPHRRPRCKVGPGAGWVQG